MNNKNNRNHGPKPPHNRPELFIDNDPYDWTESAITGAQIRELASLPAEVQIFHKIPGRPDEQVKDDTLIDLRKVHGPDHFWSQPVGSQAG